MKVTKRPSILFTENVWLFSNNNKKKLPKSWSQKFFFGKVPTTFSMFEINQGKLFFEKKEKKRSCCPQKDHIESQNQGKCGWAVKVGVTQKCPIN